MPANPLSDPHWADDLTDQIVRTVGAIRDKTTDNAIKVVRGVVFGLLAAFLGVVAVVLLLLLLTRLVQAGLDLALAHDRAVYASYLIIGGLLSIVGLLLMGKRTA